jgi:hypothetical protein
MAANVGLGSDGWHRWRGPGYGRRVRLTERALSDGQDGHEFVWADQVVGELRWRESGDDEPAGWWLTTPTNGAELVLECAAGERGEAQPRARWFAQSKVAALLADDREVRHRRRRPGSASRRHPPAS